MYGKEVYVDSAVNSTVEGWVSKLQDFVVHDGPGLRILVFIRGCPLKCTWCQNPENLNVLPEIMYRSSLCMDCGRCIEVCPVPGAIVEDKETRIDRSKCTKCMACVDACLGKAIQAAGEKVTVDQMLQRILPYKPFFDHSDRGGVTLSGGDPIFQPEFTMKLLEACRKAGIHTALETCGYTSYETLKKIVENVDLLIYDIKHMDGAKHQAETGRPNDLILDNLSRLCKEADTEIVIHIPLIRGFNDDNENIMKTAEFVSSTKKIKHIDLLPFNELASGKYKAMGKDWDYAEVKRQSKEQLDELLGIVKSYGLETTVGGLW
ncbi:MAG: glycyl-radical enzyme activating protein [Deltaproteobacteria bacterium]|nr:glycyl-radical enzyme activating protein [Deltaproteobacteria bacterium]